MLRTGREFTGTVFDKIIRTRMTVSYQSLNALPHPVRPSYRDSVLFNMDQPGITHTLVFGPKRVSMVALLPMVLPVRTMTAMLVILLND